MRPECQGNDPSEILVGSFTGVVSRLAGCTSLKVARQTKGLSGIGSFRRGDSIEQPAYVDLQYLVMYPVSQMPYVLVVCKPSCRTTSWFLI